MVVIALLSLLAIAGHVHAQPAPALQQRISAAIAAAANATGDIDYTQFVNPFIGTDNFGDVCPGASVPFGMVKITTDMTGYAPAGYVADNTQFIRGLSATHDSGTGSSLGTYGLFEIMPVECPSGFNSCPTRIVDRQRLRKNFTDNAMPGYFSLTLDNNVQMEATSTRRAGLERFTFPPSTARSPHFFVLDFQQDLPQSFKGGSMNIDPQNGRVTIGGFWGSSFGPGSFAYQAFACYDLLNGGSQKLDQYGIWRSNPWGLNAKLLGSTHLNLSQSLIGDTNYESGALFSFARTSDPIIIRVGISFISADQACSNAETEIGGASFEQVHEASRAAWNERLKRIELNLAGTPHNITEMFYSSLYRASLTPNNATGEAQGQFFGTSAPYFDSLYCSWDTFRTFYPLMTLTSPETYAEIVETYLDGWRKRGWMPECRANNLPGWTQGGSSGDVIVGHFAINYHNEAAALGVSLDDISAAQLADGELNPPEWDIEGRQVNVYKQYGFVPFDVLDPSSVGRQTREGSRTLEYVFEDFAIRQVALLRRDNATFTTYSNRSLWYRNVWDPSIKSDGYKGFMQKRRPDGSFAFEDPVNCSPNDQNNSRSCSLQGNNIEGMYESSSWEYSWFVPHDTAHLIELMGGNDTFVKRLDHFFDAGYYLAGNEPSFQTPLGYMYADQPHRAVSRIRDVVFTNFDITAGGLPGNDDQAAMATLLAFHLLGLYPVPGTSELLILSPFTPAYTVHNPYLNVSTTVTVTNFDAASVAKTIPAGASAFVHEVRVNNVTTPSRCAFDFYDTFRVGGKIEIILTADENEALGCAGPVPQSVSTGGFASVR
ncbi:glycoside hydrolase family 92 protein [Vararia minispora EC-137]|uniref:Glycoside hydrolase family 92 protein n=1 Tax=Vararia minispora EC-137 TaxID=1314806 RepID=A0ACB8QKA7_9AGAM|nr:glycoside hydrolase family 92 protein [Vararia minispora EC-137]